MKLSENGWQTELDRGEDYFFIDSKPIEVCRVARGKHCTMGKTYYSKAPVLDIVHHKRFITRDISYMSFAA